ncbi:hypothetical protein CR513_12533, partial [Mucuna pruriens]
MGGEYGIRYGILDPKIKERIVGYEGNHRPNPKPIKRPQAEVQRSKNSRKEGAKTLEKREQKPWNAEKRKADNIMTQAKRKLEQAGSTKTKGRRHQTPLDISQNYVDFDSSKVELLKSPPSFYKTKPTPPRPGPISNNSLNSSLMSSSPIASSTSAIQHRGHLSTNIDAMHRGSRAHCFPRSRKYKLKTERPKSVRGDRLGFQCTLVELILNIQAIGESNLASAETSQYSTPQILRHFASHQITIERTVFLRKIDLGSSIDPLYAFDPEIETTFHRLRKAKNLVVNNSRSSDSVIDSNQLCTNNSIASSNIFAEPRQMENNDKTLKELATPDVAYQPWCIQYPQLESAQTYELKSGLIHLLPKFHGLAGEDPHKHLKEFHVVCSTMRP